MINEELKELNALRSISQSSTEETRDDKKQE